MIENDFPVLRESVNDSVIGRSLRSIMAAVATAASEATVTRQLSSLRSSVGGNGVAAIRVGGIVLAVAAVAAWGLSQLVPLYVATAIPGVVFVAVAVLSGIAAVRADFVASQWQASRVRRLKTW